MCIPIIINPTKKVNYEKKSFQASREMVEKITKRTLSRHCELTTLNSSQVQTNR